MIFVDEVRDILDGSMPDRGIRHALEHYRLGGFHATVSAAERLQFERWLFSQAQEAPTAAPALPVGVQLDLLEACA